MQHTGKTRNPKCEARKKPEYRTSNRHLRAAAVFLISVLGLLPLFFCLPAFAQGTAFTYQGQLKNGANPAAGIYDLRFTIYDSTNNPGVLIAGPITNSAVAISNGLFTVKLDFGLGVFTGANRWLEVGVRTNGVFTTLAPRQPLTAAPYSITAGNLSGTLAASQLTGTLPTAQLSGTYSGALTFSNAANSFSGNGAGLTALNASQLVSGTVPNARLSSNVALLNTNATFQGFVQALGDLKGRRLNAGTNQFLSGDLSSIAGGADNTNRGAYSTIGGGQWNVMDADWSSIGGGIVNSIGTNSYAGMIGGGEFNSIANDSRHATIAGGVANLIGANSERTVISGGNQSTIGANSPYAAIAGGSGNNIGEDAHSSAISGGFGNNVGNFSSAAVIAGGAANEIGTNSYNSVIAGGGDNIIADSSIYAVIVGGFNNSIGINSFGSAILGGEQNRIDGWSFEAFIAGGVVNTIGTNCNQSTISGGFQNQIANKTQSATIAGGGLNSIGVDSYSSVISGGSENSIAGDTRFAAIGGGTDHSIGTNSPASVIGGGEGNTIAANANYATIPGGLNNLATLFAFAAGANARATNRGAFVWSDSTGIITGSTNSDSVTMRAIGGYRLFTGTGTTGAQLLAGATAWSVMSDRNLKKDFQPVNCQAILEKLSRIPLSHWHYTWENECEPLNLGPMAQDFKAAFYPGRDDKTISTLEIDGVALAAIQGLNEKVDLGSQKSEASIQKLEAENAELKRELGELKRLVGALAGKSNGGAK